MNKQPEFGVIEDGTLYSKSTKKADVLDDYLSIFALMLLERSAGETESNGVLIQTNATNGYVKIGWRAMSITDTSEPDYEWDLAPYIIWFPTLFDKGDADVFERPLRTAASALAQLFRTHWNGDEGAPKDAAKPMDKPTKQPSQTAFSVPTKPFFLVYLMNEIDYMVRRVRR